MYRSALAPQNCEHPLESNVTEDARQKKMCVINLNTGQFRENTCIFTSVSAIYCWANNMKRQSNHRSMAWHISDVVIGLNQPYFFTCSQAMSYAKLL